MAKTIAIINQKGGVGKSTTAHALGAGLAQGPMRKGHKKQRVLCVDLDAQGNLSYTARADVTLPGALEVLTGQAKAQDVVQTCEGGGIIAANPGLSGADMTLTLPGKEYKLKEALEPLQGDYDAIIIDTPPALGILTINALTAADDVIIPAQADIYSLQGIGQLYGTLEAVRKYTNPGLKVLGILLTRYNPRAVLSRDIADLIDETGKQLGCRAFDAKIRECIAIKEAQANQLDIFTYAPRSNAADDYGAFVREVLKRS